MQKAMHQLIPTLEPSRNTYGIEYFGAEDGTSVKSSTVGTGEPSCKAQLCRPKSSSVQVIGVALAELP